jgi:hypothetical protein
MSFIQMFSEYGSIVIKLMLTNPGGLYLLSAQSIGSSVLRLIIPITVSFTIIIPSAFLRCSIFLCVAMLDMDRSIV